MTTGYTITSDATPGADVSGDITPRERFVEDGYLVVPDALGAAALDLARQESLAICRGDRGDIEGADPVPPDETDDAALRRYLCIHFPHKISETFAAIAREPRLVERLVSVIGPNVKLMQSMLFIKSEGKPGQAWHQDEAHIPTRDRSLTAVWIALDDATVENGCLWVIPGSHRRGVLFPTRSQDDERYDCTDEAYGFGYRPDRAVPVELSAGSALIFNGYLLHRSLPNTATHGLRRALVNHYMSAESLLPWLPPVPPAAMGTHDHRDIMMVAGEDPHAHRGYSEIFRPMVRPDGRGGCVRGAPD